MELQLSLTTRARVLPLLALCTALLAAAPRAADGPTPLAPVPSPAQVSWQRMEVNAFVHFGPNTFTSVEWGSGREDPAVFSPTAFDARQWVRAFTAAGMKGVILTAKHHDGFCLWPSKLSTHTVARSPWHGGTGDVLREVADACREAGLKLGVYLSPWDRNHPAYGTADYNRVFVAMLEEVLSGYGPIFEVWFDGANGEGPNGKRQVYDWPAFHAVVKRLQPDAVIFSDGGPGVRWVGNERGQGSVTSWSLLDRNRYVPGTPFSDDLGEGSRLGHDWVPPECDVSIRPGWFYRASEDARVKTAATLFRLYEQSVGRNCQLLLNVPPDTRGLIATRDVDALAGMRRAIEGVYAVNLAHAGRITADASRAGFGAARALDGNIDTFWSAPDTATHGRLTIALPAPITFNRVVLQEPIAHGQRVGAFEVEALTPEGWARIAAGSTIGYKRILPVTETRTDQVRITIHEARAQPLLAEIALHRSQIAE